MQLGNPYSYVSNQAWNARDPSGLFVMGITAAIGAGVGAVAGAVTYGIVVATTDAEFDAGELGKAALVGGVAGALIGSGVGMAQGIALAGGSLAAGGAGVATASGLAGAGIAVAGQFVSDVADGKINDGFEYVGAGASGFVIGMAFAQPGVGAQRGALVGLGAGALDSATTQALRKAYTGMSGESCKISSKDVAVTSLATGTGAGLGGFFLGQVGQSATRPLGGIIFAESTSSALSEGVSSVSSDYYDPGRAPTPNRCAY